MYTCPIQMTDVHYNAANQCFEAKVTVHDNSTIRAYACTLDAPITLSFEEAATGLCKQAIQRHQHRGGLFSETHPLAQRTRPAQTKRGPVAWLHDLLDIPKIEAA